MPTGLTVRTPTAEIGYEAHGDATGFPPLYCCTGSRMMSAPGTPWRPLVAAGYRVLVPYLRGYGPTRFLDAAAPRMAQQAAIAQDLFDFMEALGLDHVGLAGYDWGGRAACITAILAPERVQALVTIGGYNVQNTHWHNLQPPPSRQALWYQGTLTLSGVGWASNSIAVISAGYSGRSGHRPGTLTTPPSTARRRPSTIPILCRWCSTLPPPPRQCPGRSALRRGRASPGGATADHGADDCAARADDGVSLSRRYEGDMELFPTATARHVVADAGHFMPREQPGAVANALLTLLQPRR